MRYSDEQLSVLCLAATEGIGPATIRQVLGAAQEMGASVEELLQVPPGELDANLSLRPQLFRLLRGVVSPALAAEHVLGELARVGARPIFEGSADYPKKLTHFLGRNAPPVLFVVGDAGILRNSCVAVVGSRRPSRLARRRARAFALSQGAVGTTVVSGGADGIDTAAHKGAIESGATVVVPPVGLSRFRWRSVRNEQLEDGRWCLVGQFPPQEGWKDGNALMRNRTVVALADAVVGFEPRAGGGTWHSCCVAIEMRKPLFVTSARGDPTHRAGLRRLARRGAQVIELDRMPDVMDFERMVADYAPPERPAQLPLFREKGQQQQ